MSMNVNDVRHILSAFTDRIRGQAFPDHPATLFDLNNTSLDAFEKESIEANRIRLHGLINSLDAQANEQAYSFERQQNMILLALSLSARLAAFEAIGDGQEQNAALENEYIALIARKINQLTQDQLDKAAWDLIHFKEAVQSAIDHEQDQVEHLVQREANGRISVQRQRGGIERPKIAIAAITCDYFRSLNIHSAPTPTAPFTSVQGPRSLGYLIAGQVFPEALQNLIKTANTLNTNLNEVLQVAPLELEDIKSIYEVVQLLATISNDTAHKIKLIQSELKTAQEAIHWIQVLLDTFKTKILALSQTVSGLQNDHRYGHCDPSAITKAIKEINESYRKTLTQELIRKKEIVTQCRKKVGALQHTILNEINPNNVLSKVAHLKVDARIRTNAGTESAGSYAAVAKIFTNELNASGKPIQGLIAQASVQSVAAQGYAQAAENSLKAMVQTDSASLNYKLEAEITLAKPLLILYKQQREEYSKQFTVAMEASNPNNIGIGRRYESSETANQAKNNAMTSANQALNEARDTITRFEPHAKEVFKQLELFKGHYSTIVTNQSLARNNYNAVKQFKEAAALVKP